MKTIQTTLALMLAALLTSSAWAGEGSETKGDRPGREEMRQKILDEFDDDGDGKLNEDERAAAREEMRSRRGDRGRGGPDARGRRDRGPDDRGPEGRRRGLDRDPEGFRGREGRGPEGRRGPPEGRGGPPNPEEMFERFDTNGDDQLSREEFMKMARAVRAMHERRGRGGPPERGDRGPRSGRRFGPGGDRDDDRRPGRQRPPRPDFDTDVETPPSDETA